MPNKPIQIPNDRQIWQGEIATYWFEQNVLVSLSKPPKRTVALIQNNVTLVQKITQHTPVPLLIHLCDSPVPNKETRKFSSTQLPVIYKAMAMVSKPGLSQLIMKVLFAINPPPIPIKSFTKKHEALKWLQQFV
jgi:hypothetical protein